MALKDDLVSAFVSEIAAARWLTLAEVAKRSNVARFARSYMTRLQLSLRR